MASFWEEVKIEELGWEESDDDLTDKHRPGWREIYRVRIENNFHQKPIRQMRFYMICETEEVCIDVAYNTMKHILSIKVGKVQQNVHSSLSSGKGALPL